MKALALVAAFACANCGPTFTAITKRCPTTTMLLGDFGITTLGLAVGTLKVNAGKNRDAAIVIGAAMGLSLLDDVAEVKCRR